MNAPTNIATLVIDCRDAAPMMAMYEALGAIVDARYPGNDSVLLDGLTITFRERDDYVPPTWPENSVPEQLHLDFFVDSPDETERELRQHGATTASYQPHRDSGLIVMLDPAGHPFCIGTRR